MSDLYWDLSVYFRIRWYKVLRLPSLHAAIGIIGAHQPGVKTALCMPIRKLLMHWSWTRDVNGRDKTETSTSRDRDETETLTTFLETRLRRDVGTSQDRHVETETTTLLIPRKS